jgi:hypothetical protein
LGKDLLGPPYCFISLVLGPQKQKSAQSYIPQGYFPPFEAVFRTNKRHHHHHYLLFCLKTNKRHHHLMMWVPVLGSRGLSPSAGRAEAGACPGRGVAPRGRRRAAPAMGPSPLPMLFLGTSSRTKSDSVGEPAPGGPGEVSH